MFIDSHAHLSSDELFPDIGVILEKAKEARVDAILNICTDLATLKRGIELSQCYPWVYLAAATHPHDVQQMGEKEFAFIAAFANTGTLKAIGEIGLDYHYHHSSKESQHFFLRRYLQLALEAHLPVIVHCREAFADFFSILDEEYRVHSRHAPGVLHCFTGTIQEAEEVLKRGWYLSLSGIVTFKKSIELHEVAKQIPLNQLLIETDSPFLSPQSKRGKKNEPANVVEVASFIAQIKGISVEEVALATTKNARDLFAI